MNNYMILTNKMIEILLLGGPILKAEVNLNAVVRLRDLGLVKEGELTEEDIANNHPAYYGRGPGNIPLIEFFMQLTSKGEEVRTALVTLLEDGVMTVPEYIVNKMPRR